MNPAPFCALTRAIILRAIAAQETPEKRADFARIAHADGNISDEQLAFYVGSIAA